MSNHEEQKLLLENSRLFGAFSPAVVAAALPLLTPCRFEADSMICMKGDDSDSLYLIAEGEAEVTVSSSDGRIILLGILSRGDVFGEVGLLDKGSRTANVTAKTALKAFRLSNSDFTKITKLFTVDEWMALTSYICFLFRGVTNNLEEAAFLDAGIRIARKIRTLYLQSDEKDAPSFSLGLSQETLGRMAGLSREATNKALSEIEGKGLIERKYKRIDIPDIAKFFDYIEHKSL